jgi:Spy/CpxP family protein refolding chaperone
MRISYLAGLIFIVSQVWAQGPPETTPGPLVRGGGMVAARSRSDSGKWWENSDVANRLKLTDAQVAQLDKTFYEHRLKLIDYGADMQKQDLKLQTLLDQDVPNDNQVSAQVDQVLAARGKLEREFTMMNLDLRKVLSVEQWKQLKSIRGERGMTGGNFFFRRFGPGEAPPDGPPPLPPPGPGPMDPL